MFTSSHRRIGADEIHCSQTMNCEHQTVGEFPRKPRVVHRGPASIEDLLRYVDPAPDEETERLIARPSMRIGAMIAPFREKRASKGHPERVDP